MGIYSKTYITDNKEYRTIIKEHKLSKTCIWQVALHGSETWTMNTSDERWIEAFIKD